jgi:hypothetical protein
LSLTNETNLLRQIFTRWILLYGWIIIIKYKQKWASLRYSVRPLPPPPPNASSFDTYIYRCLQGSQKIIILCISTANYIHNPSFELKSTTNKGIVYLSLSNTTSKNLAAQVPRHTQIKQAKHWLRNNATQSTQKFTLLVRQQNAPRHWGWRGCRRFFTPSLHVIMTTIS